MHVVDEAVPVVVDAVTRDFPGVRPDVGLEIGVLQIDAGVDDRDEGPARSGRDVPRLLGMDVGAGLAAGLAGIVEAVELRVPRIVRREGRLDDVVGLGVLDPRIPAEARDRLFGGKTRGEFPVLRPAPEGVPARGAELRPQCLVIGRRGPRFELDDHRAGGVGPVDRAGDGLPAAGRRAGQRRPRERQGEDRPGDGPSAGRQTPPPSAGARTLHPPHPSPVSHGCAWRQV